MSAAAVIAMAVGCQKLNNHVKPGNQQDDNDGRPVAVKFKSNVVNVQTRASLTGLNGSNDLYIHGLNRSKPGVGEIINAKAHMAKPSGAEDGWSVAEGSLQFADGKTFFYNGTRDVYDFYGYYVADAAVVPEKLTDYKIDVTIDGTQDILLAKADPAKDILAPTVNADVVTSTEYVYSAWASRRGVTPNMEFKHVLAQYKFEVKNSGTEDVVLQSIHVTSKTNGILTVVDDADFVQGLAIKDGDNDVNLELKSTTFVPGGAVLDPMGEGEEDDVKVDGVRLPGLQLQPLPLQGEIMTFAGQENQVVLRLVQKGMPEGSYRQITMDITLDETKNYGKVTKPGYSYLVSLVVYSLEKTDITVSLIPWQDGGTVLLDQEVEASKPDTDYRDEIIYGE